ncbi:MAG: hypothetical protein V4667_04705 [Bacteroidota bacterium]
MKTLIIVFSVLVSISFFFACKKKKDEELPKIEIVSPSIGDKYNDNNDVDFTINVSDNLIIENIKVNLVDADKRAVSSTLTEFPKQKKYEWKSYVTIDASKINASGTYYLNFVANDGTNIESVYLPVYITETLLHKKAIYIITNEFAKGAEIQKLDSVNNLSVFTRLTGDYLGAAIDNKYKRVYTCGNYEGPLQAIDTRNASRLWKLDTPLNNSKYFSAISASSGMVYVGFYEGFFQGFNEKGERFFSTKNTEDVNYFPEKFFRSTNNIVTFERHKGENKKRLKSYYLSGNAHQEMYIDFEPIAILAKEANTCFVLANKDEKANLYVYDIEANSYYNPTLISGKIICAAKAENKVVYCDGTSILVYDDATNSLTLLKNNFVAEKLEYDITTNELIALQKGVVYLIDFANGSTKKSIAVNSNASDILLQLSK